MYLSGALSGVPAARGAAHSAHNGAAKESDKSKATRLCRQASARRSDPCVASVLLVCC